MILARFRQRGAPLAVLLVVALLAPALPIRKASADEGPQPEGAREVDVQSSHPTDSPVAIPVEETAPAPSDSTTAAGASPGATASPIKGTTSQLSLPQGAGKLRGMGESFSAELSTGIATYQVPFALPAARGAVQPSLGLSYASSGGQGIAGAGWGVGTPTISRQMDRGVPQYRDPAEGAGWTPDQDRFVFGNQELVPICLVQGGTCAGVSEAMPSWAAGWQYFRSRVEGSFQRFFWSPDRQTWKIQTKDGITTELGVPLDGSNDTTPLEVDPSNASRIFSWHTARQYDAQGDANPGAGALPRPVNSVVYKYRVVDGISYLSDIFDTSPVASPTAVDVTRYAHHTHLRYELRPDVSTSYRRGWAVRSSQRLTTVDITSFDFGGGTAARELLRRYHLAYDPTSHVSLLTSVQMEGRCAQPVLEASGVLPASTGCPTLPAMTFAYQRVAPYGIDGSPAAPDLPGFEGFDERVHAMTSSPPHSIDESLADLFDLNSDGLPDVLLTDPATHGGKHAVFFNGAAGKRDGFGGPATVGVEGVLAEDAYTLRLSNRNVSSHDVDGDATVNLLHMPIAKTYSIYSPLLGALGWVWRGRSVTTTSQQSPKIDFSQKSEDIRLMDANADGLVDVVYSSPTEYQTFLSLGRYPGGDGQYGLASFTGPTTANIVNDPATSCTPWSSTAVRFSNSDVRVADMNGDSFPDVVRVRPGSILYWPGRGNGFWGTGDTPCPSGTLGGGREVAMVGSPHFGVTSGSYLLMEDVNGDALADLIKVNFNQVDIYLNVDGSGWTSRHVITNAPANSTISNRVRLVDVNGSGTPDILWGEGRAYKYIDLAGGARPWVLTRAANGLGRTTEFEYSSSVDQMLAAEVAGNAWQTKAPMPVHVVSRITDRDHLELVGRPKGIYVTEYTYRDPVFEGRQRDFRGFRTVRAKKIGDVNSPTSVSESTFLLGECQDEPPAAGTCQTADRWRDNPREALKGLPVLTETFDEGGQYLVTSHSTFRLRRLFVGLDGREVRHAFQVATDTYRYDTGPFVPSASSTTLSDVELERTPNSIEPILARTVTLRSSAGRAHLRTRVNVDSFGNVVDGIDFGCVEGCVAADETITVHAEPAVHPDDSSGWIWRTVEEWVQGSSNPAVPRNHATTVYDARGLAQSVTGELSGTLALDRFHELSGRSVAPTPGSAVQDGRFVIAQKAYDPFGSVVEEVGNPGHCRSHEFDTVYAQLPIREAVGTGYAESGCGTYELATLAEYDRGIGGLTKLTDPAGAVSKVSYDGFGRTVAIYKPDPDVLGVASSVPAIKTEYILPADPATTPYSKIHNFVQDGASATTASFVESWTHIDGLGRAIVSVSQADPAAGDDGAWVVQGRTDYDAKGAASRGYLNSFYNGDPSTLPINVTAPSTRLRYDPFGRPVQSYGLDGMIALRTVHHAMSADGWDAADIEAGPHSGTPSTVRTDGHGRQVSAIERVHAGNQLEERETRVTYLPTGEPHAISRNRVGSPSVVRWLRYDSFGRMVLNVEPNATKNFNPDPNTDPSSLKAWRYAYDPAGQLIATSDPRGCGINYSYLADGRLLGEDYSPCRAEHTDYSVPDMNSGDGLEVYNRYDVPDPDAAGIPDFSFPSDSILKGRLTSSSDRGGKTILRYDARGRVTGAARRMAKPGSAAVSSPADRYAPHWYLRTSTYDGADRPTAQSTGADVQELLGANVSSLVATEYTKRGNVKSVGGSYGVLVSKVTHDADGLTGQIVYGDVAQTTSTLGYDGRRRLASAFTHREPPALWSAEPPAYSPAPNPASGPSVFQTILEDASFDYDNVDNPIAIYDLRDPADWPVSAKPVTREFEYDDLYRVTRVGYGYSAGRDTWVSPFAAENAGTSDRASPSPHVSFPERMVSQSFQYDWLGNTRVTDDDAHGFYDRSLGQVANGAATAGPYQLKSASQSTSGGRDGSLTAAYDDAGGLASLAVRRGGPCLPSGAQCSQRFAYEWDEAGRLARARRWDLLDSGTASDPLPFGPAAAELRYEYDGGNDRTLKTAVDVGGNELHTVYVFDSLELRRARWGEGEYERTSETEAVNLSVPGARLGRLYYAGDDVPTLSSGHLHVLLELADHLGSTSFVVDRATSELVEATRYQAYGATESDYRPDRWKVFREDYRFTGKEDDVEVGLTYFGQRYLSPALNRWASADPLAVHVPGSADLNLYAYVRGHVLKAVDPFGLEEKTIVQAQGPHTNTTLTITSPDAAGGARNAQTPAGHVTQAIVHAQSGNFGQAAPSLSAGVSQGATQHVPLGPVPSIVDGVEAANKVYDAYQSSGLSGGAKEYGRQLAERLPIVGGLLRAREAMKQADASQDEVSRAGALADATYHVATSVAETGAVIIVGGRAASERGAPAPQLSGGVRGAGAPAGSAGAMRRFGYEPSPKHPVGVAPRPGVSPGPTNGQAALDTSVEIGPNTARRVGIDYASREFVVFDETHPGKGIFHGHVRSWDALGQQMQNALTRAGLTTRRGEIQQGN